MAETEQVCIECGNDIACEGYLCCSDCLEELGHAAPGEPGSPYG